MLTLFTIPKPFTGHIGVIQRNALESWRRLDPDVEIILCGDDAGVAEAARDVGARHIGGLSRTDYGTPLLDDAFRQALAAARHDRVAYVNADIVLMGDFAAALRQVTLPHYLLLGRRWLLDVEAPLAFANGWEDALRRRVEAEGTLDVIHSLDYFVMPRPVLADLVADMPPFAVGRPWWDTWLLFQARRRGVPVIDATSSVRVVHQNHDYGHVPAQRQKKWHGPEGDRNRQLAGGERLPRMGATDATHILGDDGVQLAQADEYLYSRVKRLVAMGSAPARRTQRWFARVLLALFHRRDYFPEPYWRRWLYKLTR